MKYVREVESHYLYVVSGGQSDCVRLVIGEKAGDARVASFEMTREEAKNLSSDLWIAAVANPSE